MNIKFDFLARLLTAAAISIAGTAIAPGSAFAATGATVPIGGTVTPTLNIVATPAAGAGALDLSGGAKVAIVATLAIDTNNSTGYTMTATAGDMVNPTATTPIPYQVTSVAGGAAAPAAGTFAAGTYSYSSNAANAAATGGRDLYIAYTPAALQDPGAYTATITLGVTDN